MYYVISILLDIGAWSGCNLDYKPSSVDRVGLKLFLLECPHLVLSFNNEDHHTRHLYGHNNRDGNGQMYGPITCII